MLISVTGELMMIHERLKLGPGAQHLTQTLHVGFLPFQFATRHLFLFDFVSFEKLCASIYAFFYGLVLQVTQTQGTDGPAVYLIM